MDWKDFRKSGKEMIDYISDYLEMIRNRRVFPEVKPGYMRLLLPDSAPYNGEDWDTEIFPDIERVIMPGVTHWQSPYMHAYFPALNSPASLLGDMLANAIACLGFTWASSPACTELEMIVMDWLAKMIGLPNDFLHSRSDSRGGGVIQSTASEATFVALLAARTEAILRVKEDCSEHIDDADINSRLVAYCSDQAHSSVEKAGLIGLVRMRYVESDDKLSLRGDKLLEAIQYDKDKGLIPFFICATLGTTGACAFDNISEIGPIAREQDIWIHVDAAYAGTAFICPEFRKWMIGMEFVQSFAFNPSKWMMVHFDCTAMWVRNSSALHRTFNVEPLYLKHENSGLAVDFMHWQIALSRRFRALKLWFVIRNYGVKGLQQHIRNGVKLAIAFEEMVKSDIRFEIAAQRHLAMVVFRLKGDNELTETLLRKLNSSGKLHCVPAALKGAYVIRFTVTSYQTTIQDINRDWDIIKETATIVIKSYGIAENDVHLTRAIPLAEIRKRTPGFGTSLLLSNSPMTPKIINGSFVAIFDQQDITQQLMKHFGNVNSAKNSPLVRRRIKGLMLTNKQHSLDSRMDLMNTIMATMNVTRNDRPKVINKLSRNKRTSNSSSIESLPGEAIEEKDESGESDVFIDGDMATFKEVRKLRTRLCPSNSQ